MYSVGVVGPLKNDRGWSGGVVIVSESEETRLERPREESFALVASRERTTMKQEQRPRRQALFQIAKVWFFFSPPHECQIRFRSASNVVPCMFVVSRMGTLRRDLLSIYIGTNTHSEYYRLRKANEMQIKWKLSRSEDFCASLSLE